MRFLHTADLHLKEGDEKGFEVLTWIVKKAKEKGCDAVLISGDLFHKGHTAYGIRGRVRSIFEGERGLKFVLIPGNHDKEAYEEGAFYGENVAVLSRTPYEWINIKGINLVGVPHQEGRLSEILTDFRFNPLDTVLLIHGSLLTPWIRELYEDEIGDMSFSFSEIKDKGSYIALGHNHNRFYYREEGGVHLVYPGSPTATSIKDLGERKVALVDVSPGRGVDSIIPLSVEVGVFWERKVFYSCLDEERLIEELDSYLSGIKEATNKGLIIQLDGFLKSGEREFNERINSILNLYKNKFFEIKPENNLIMYGDLYKSPFVYKFIEMLNKKYPHRDEIYLETLRLFLEGLKE